MKILISTNVAAFKTAVGQDRHISFSEPGADLSIALTKCQPVHVWIGHGSEITNPLLDQWLSQTPRGSAKVILVEDDVSLLRVQQYARGRVTVAGFPGSSTTNKTTKEELVLREAEILYARGLEHGLIREKKSSGQSTVLLVGAGITNLITAEFLAARGFRVRVVDAGPDPCNTNDWSRLGITSGGGNARMFTHTEADNYNEKGDGLYSDMQGIFRKTAREGGWSVKNPKSFTSAENAWVDEFEQLSPWLARAFKENILQITREAGKLWDEYVRDVPELFEEVEYRKDIVRLYAEPRDVVAAIKLTSELGTILEAPSPSQFLASNPGFRSAAAADHLAGGIKVEGFTVNIHPFVAGLIKHITHLGGVFEWDFPVRSIERDAQGDVAALCTTGGKKLHADHFVLSLGVTGNELLHGTASENLMQGVLGVWLQIPNLHPQVKHSIKIHRRGHLVEDINITVAKDTLTGEDILQFGGGYGYVGLDWPAPDSPELAALFTELEEVARIYFPRGYAAAKEQSTLFPGGHRKFCVRPFTPTGLGVFETTATANGGLLITTGGNNTGGFAQAPALAQAVYRALVGEHDQVHVLYHPSRGRLAVPWTSCDQAAPRVISLPVLEPSPKSHFAQKIVALPQLSESNVRVRNSANSGQPLRLLLLCSDSPQHRYLRYLFDIAFPGYHCIVEPGAGQLRQLRAKGRLTEARWQKYHGLRRRFLGHDRRREAYFDNLVPDDHISPKPDLIVDSLNCRAVWDAVDVWQPEITIVSGTKFIGKKLNDRSGLTINLHTGHLPEYKGNHCIFFALRDGALGQVASTLHQLTSQLDGGHVLDVVYADISPSDDEEALYTKCVHLAMQRALEHVERFARGERLEFVAQEEDVGRVFRHSDRTPVKELSLWWKTRFGGLLRERSREVKSTTTVAEVDKF